MADKIRVLYVDDELDLLELSRMFLEQSGDFSITTIDSAIAALELLEKEQFDAIISDYHMPDMDGIQFLIEVRKRFGQVPFILFTGRGREEIVIKAINSGADLYLQKGGETVAQFAELAHKTRIVVERHATIAALKESEEKNRRIVETSHEGIWVMDQDFFTTYVNERMATMLGCNADEMLGKSILSFLPEEDLADQKEKFRQRYEGKPGTYERRFQDKDGKTRVFNVSATPLTGDDGSPQGSFAMLTDITDRKDAELALQKAHDNLEVQVQERTSDLYSANLKLQKEIEYSNLIAESLKEYSKMTSTLNEVIITANKAETLPNLFRDSLDRALELLDFEAGGIYLVNPEKRTAEVHYSKNLPDDFIEKTRVIPIDAPPYDTLLARGQPVITEHFEEFSPELAGKFPIRSLASIPLISKNSVIGSLNVANTKRDTLSADEIQVLTAIGRELGTTIARMIAEEEVKTVSVNLQTLFASINEMVFVLDMEGRIISVNDSVIKRLQYTNEELTGMNVLLLHVPERRDEALRNVQGMIAGTVESCPVPLLSKDGTRTEVETTVTRGWWNGQEVLIGVTRDITERKQMEEALKESEIKYRTMFDNSGDAILIHDINGRILDVNPVLCDRLGYSWEEMLKMTPMDFDSPEYAALVPERIRQVMMKEHHIFETCNVRKDGTRIPTEINVRLIDYNGQQAVMSLGRDITERKRVEMTLNDNYLFMQTLIQTIPIPVFIKNREGTYTGCNKTFETFFGRSKDEIIGKTVYDVAPKEIADEYLRTDEDLLNSLGTQHYEGRVVSKNGQTRDVMIDKAAIMNSDGEATGIIGVMFDITDRKEREKEMTYHEQELMRFSSSLAAVNKKLALLSHITRHDINNQLEVLLGYLSLLKYRKLDPTLDEYFQKITTAAERIAVMIRFTREYGSIGVNAPAWQDCATLVDTAAKLAMLGQVEVNNEIPGSAGVFADPLIVKVFYNLMDNAFRYGGNITTIRFSVQESDDGTGIIVCEDDGIGVPAEEKEKIFLREFGQNTGLGLALSREILDITGITIRETGEPGKGARFEMIVPKGAWRSNRGLE